MKFKILTLVDITETGARKGTNDKRAYNQQQNFQTVIQTIGLRANLEYTDSPTITVANASAFGSDYKGKHKIWEFEFYINYEGATSVDYLKKDFELVPFIQTLDETAEFPASVFKTKDSKQKNIVFKHID